ncbi:hypothetical protein [Williamsoniiplasma lucivorax]|uniref:Lipoprotein n=1 Tax=Williamsoniiplasma lucivorax TaxID=209274 RepID=A0A2S5RDU8_9MOLU|nr:hypothetical protein [Williamsoniiplasma lucivorax]PPE05491.1 hypothetical protein ELUCI_v1c05840 [Williamsoniiplasma lucivorax]
MKKLLISLLSLTLMGSTSLVCVSSSKVVSKIQDEKIQAIEDNLEKNAIKISKTDKQKYNINIDKYKKKLFKKRSLSTKSTLEEKSNNHIELFDIKNNVGTQRIYVYDRDKIENEIYSFIDTELNEMQNNDYNFDEEVKFINKYLHINTLHYDNKFKSKMSELFLYKIESSKDEEKQYLSNYAWKQYEKPIREEDKPNYFYQSINGFSQVYSPSDDFILMGMETLFILTVSKALGPIKDLALPMVVPIVTKALLSIGIKIPDTITKMIIKSVINNAVSTPLKKILGWSSLTGIIKSILQYDKLRKILFENKKVLTEEYNEDIWDRYFEFFMKGFENGFWGKWNSTFGGTSVKDRAVIIFDEVKNPLWNLKSITSHSTAKFRKWIPWLTYTNQKTVEHNIDKNKKLTFFTATLAVKGTWTGTFYGPVDNDKSGDYDLDWSANFLEKTTLELKPNINKKSTPIAKILFVSENLKYTKNKAKIYQNNKQEFNDAISPKTKDILSKYPIESTTNNYKFLSFGHVFD